ncbi:MULTISPECIES: hypothetical protein [unclassified Leisingera]|uniref:hypothetical protein n=1 Tax=unclassified Leisingera TaxID=2614906 RepID=UPI0010126B85|nr:MULTISPECIES: hypothetical protein [unclassified Leisingera]MCF6433639.1 hypothetical protein [Leisingera sp. MMG026]QAX29310.1 hypothetical protein ETW24_08055 [Leisingera sp. NJS204]
MNFLDLGKTLSGYLNALSQAGLQVEMFTDFEKVPDAAAETGRRFQMPGFAIERADHTRNSAFWLFLKEGDTYVGGAASMLQDLGRETLAEFLLRTSRHQFPNDAGGGVESVAEPLAREVSGRLAYIGELNFLPGHRGKRAERLEPFMRIFQILAIQKWDVDWIYAFIPDRHMQARLDLVYGFSRAIPRAQKWRDPEPEVRSSTEWFVGASRLEMEHMLQSDLAKFDIL